MRQFKAHYGRLTGRIREAGNNSARKAAQSSPKMAMHWRKKLNSPNFPAKSKARLPEREVKFDFARWIVPELRARAANLKLVLPRNRPFRRGRRSRPLVLCRRTTLELA
jgi:hypothetical protein